MVAVAAADRPRAQPERNLRPPGQVVERLRVQLEAQVGLLRAVPEQVRQPLALPPRSSSELKLRKRPQQQDQKPVAQSVALLKLRRVLPPKPVRRQHRRRRPDLPRHSPELRRLIRPHRGPRRLHRNYRKSDRHGFEEHAQSERR